MLSRDDHRRCIAACRACADRRRPARTGRCRRGRGGRAGRRGRGRTQDRGGAHRSPGGPTSSRKTRGLLVFDRERLDRLNLVDEAITLGTLPPFAVVEPRQMVATVKIIPFAAPEAAVEASRRGGAARKVRCCGWRPSCRARSALIRPGSPD